MSRLMEMAAMPLDRAGGAGHTAREIVQQPAAWPRVIDALVGSRGEIRRLLSAAHVARGHGTGILLTGAGSSAYAAQAAAPSLRARLGRTVEVIPTTRLVTHPLDWPHRGGPALAVHLARSGDSPESAAALRLLRKLRPDLRHVVITCNVDGGLARLTANDPSAFVIALPEETNDRSLAMTSSFTSMALAVIALGWLDDMDALRSRVAQAARSARNIIEGEADRIAEFAGRPFNRACFLASGPIEDVLPEAALKMLELSAGRTAVIRDSFLGVRHGPQVFADSSCIIVACLSASPGVLRYELDLLRELRRKGQGAGILAIAPTEEPALTECADLAVVLADPDEVGSGGIPDELRVLSDVVACQVLAFHRSIALGLAPDNPSPDGVINRVVAGVTIYDGQETL